MEENNELIINENEQKNEKIKKVFKKVLLIVVPIIVIMFISFVILKYIGNLGIIVREYAIYNEKLPSSFDGIKITHFSDLHYNEDSSISKIENEKQHPSVDMAFFIIY